MKKLDLLHEILADSGSQQVSKIINIRSVLSSSLKGGAVGNSTCATNESCSKDKNPANSCCTNNTCSTAGMTNAECTNNNCTNSGCEA